MLWRIREGGPNVALTLWFQNLTSKRSTAGLVLPLHSRVQTLVSAWAPIVVTQTTETDLDALDNIAPEVDCLRCAVEIQQFDEGMKALDQG